MERINQSETTRSSARVATYERHLLLREILKQKPFAQASPSLISSVWGDIEASIHKQTSRKFDVRSRYESLCSLVRDDHERGVNVTKLDDVTRQLLKEIEKDRMHEHRSESTTDEAAAVSPPGNVSSPNKDPLAKTTTKRTTAAGGVLARGRKSTRSAQGPPTTRATSADKGPLPKRQRHDTAKPKSPAVPKRVVNAADTVQTVGDSDGGDGDVTIVVGPNGAAVDLSPGSGGPGPGTSLVAHGAGSSAAAATLAQVLREDIARSHDTDASIVDAIKDITSVLSTARQERQRLMAEVVASVAKRE